MSDLPEEQRPSPVGAIDLSVLTPAERDVVRLALTGLSVREISEQLVVGESTVHTHLTHIYRKLGVRGRLGLLALRPNGEARELEVPPRWRTKGLEIGVGVAGVAVVFAVLLPVTAFVSAPALLAALIAARRMSPRLDGASIPLFIGGLVCFLFAVGSILLVRPA